MEATIKGGTKGGEFLIKETEAQNIFIPEERTEEHRLMEAPFVRGRLLVARITVNRVRGFDWQVVKAVDKHAYRRGDSKLLASGFIPAGM